MFGKDNCMLQRWKVRAMTEPKTITTEGEKRLRKLLRLCEKQKWICWICGFPMLKPLPQNRTHMKGPGKWEANLDHIREGKKASKIIDLRAAHAGCNAARGHKEIDDEFMQRYIKGVTTKFSNPNWLVMTGWNRE
jgi:hypothetical protein